jgi:hypothetical protein
MLAVGRAIRGVSFSHWHAFYLIECHLDREWVVTIRTPIAFNRPLRWGFYSRWLVAALIGISIGLALENALPHEVRYPQEDENIWLEQPWRLIPLTCAYYIPLSLAQWLVLRRYVRHAWWWLLITLGSVIVGYPASIYALWNLGLVFGRNGLELPGTILLELAWIVWFFGLGGISVYFVAQWLAMLCWSSSKRNWGIGWVATSLGWLLALMLLAWITGSTEQARGNDFTEKLYTFASAGLYQITLGGVLAIIVQPNLGSETTQTLAE